MYLGGVPSEPFAWISAIVAATSLVAAARTRAPWARGAYLVCFGISLALTVAEIGLGVYERMHAADPSATYDREYFIPDAALGYAPKPGVRVASKLVVRDTVIYDVTYTIDSNGERVTKGNPLGESWLFAGCSFTFGEGVNDDETLPSQFSAALGGRANVVNLGFHGYGAHQMLRILETDRAQRLVRSPVRQLVYLAIDDHPHRAAGRSSWDRLGPSYELTGTGVTYAGPFHSRIVSKLFGVAMRSHVFALALDLTAYRATVSGDDIERWARIVERSAVLTREKYGAGFTVLFWDDDNDVSRRALARLRATKVPIVLVSEIIPRSEWPSMLLPHDGHPKPEAYRRLAAGLAERLNH